MNVHEKHSSGPYSPARRTARFVSNEPVTVAILKQDEPFAYGVIANISEGGVCLITDAESLAGSLTVRMSFYNAEVVEADARAMWSCVRAQTDGGLVRHGLRFFGVSERNIEKLKTILVSPALRPLGASNTGALGVLS